MTPHLIRDSRSIERRQDAGVRARVSNEEPCILPPSSPEIRQADQSGESPPEHDPLQSARITVGWNPRRPRSPAGKRTATRRFCRYRVTESLSCLPHGCGLSAARTDPRSRLAGAKRRAHPSHLLADAGKYRNSFFSLLNRTFRIVKIVFLIALRKMGSSDQSCQLSADRNEISPRRAPIRHSSEENSDDS